MTTWSIVQQHEERIDTAVSEPDAGIYDAMNKAARLATGDWIIYMNAGDTFASPHVLSELAEALSSDADVIWEALSRCWLTSTRPAGLSSYLAQ